jgi:hypothetical protein
MKFKRKIKALCVYNINKSADHLPVIQCGKKVKYIVYFTETDGSEKLYSQYFCKKHFKKVENCSNAGAYEKL